MKSLSTIMSNVLSLLLKMTETSHFDYCIFLMMKNLTLSLLRFVSQVFQGTTSAQKPSQTLLALPAKGQRDGSSQTKMAKQIQN